MCGRICHPIDHRVRQYSTKEREALDSVDPPCPRQSLPFRFVDGGENEIASLCYALSVPTPGPRGLGVPEDRPSYSKFLKTICYE